MTADFCFLQTAPLARILLPNWNEGHTWQLICWNKKTGRRNLSILSGHHVWPFWFLDCGRVNMKFIEITLHLELKQLNVLIMFDNHITSLSSAAGLNRTGLRQGEVLSICFGWAEPLDSLGTLAGYRLIKAVLILHHGPQYSTTWLHQDIGFLQ